MFDFNADASSTDASAPPDSLPHIPISQADVDEFRRLIRESYHVELTEQEAWDRLADLVTVARVILGPLPEDRWGKVRMGSDNVPLALIPPAR